MIVRIKIALVIFALSVSAGSCIRDEVPPCPPLRVELVVKDKNYANADRVDLVPERPTDLAFREYVPTLRYALRDLNTGEVVEEKPTFAVEGDMKTIPVTFDEQLPHGTYELIVWGGQQSEASLAENRLSAGLHPGGGEGDDLFMVTDTLVYDAYNSQFQVGLERMKGKLVIGYENIPARYYHAKQTVSGIQTEVDYKQVYTGLTEIESHYQWPAGTDAITETALAPSVKKKSSKLVIHLYDPNRPSTILHPKDVMLTIYRNELTVLRYVYIYETGECEIYMRMNDRWELLHVMDIVPG